MDEMPIWMMLLINLGIIIGVGFGVNALGFGTEFIASTMFLIIGIVLLAGESLVHVYPDFAKDYLDDEMWGITPQMVIGELSLLWLSVWFFS